MDYPNFYNKGTAPCTQADWDDFIPPLDAPESAIATARAKKVCRGCNYLSECLEWAVYNGEPGVWGGTTTQERRRIRSRRRKAMGITNGKAKITPDPQPVVQL